MVEPDEKILIMVEPDGIDAYLCYLSTRSRWILLYVYISVNIFFANNLEKKRDNNSWWTHLVLYII
jgi:hypothetical protein